MTRCDGRGVNRGTGSGSRASTGGRPGVPLPRVRGPLDQADRRPSRPLTGRRSRRTSTTHPMLTKGPTDSPRERRGGRLGWLSSTFGRPRVLMLDRVTERRRAAKLARHYRDQEGRRSRRSLVGWDAQKRPSRRISTIRLARRHARSRRATGECVAAAGRPPRHGTARATPTRIANAAIPARSRRNGPGNGFARRCAHGERATALRRPRMTGRAPTHAGAAAKRSNDYRPENGPHRPPSPICTAAWAAAAPTPSPAPERPGHNAVVTRTLALRLVICERRASTVAAHATAIRLCSSNAGVRAR